MLTEGTSPSLDISDIPVPNTYMTNMRAFTYESHPWDENDQVKFSNAVVMSLEILKAYVLSEIKSSINS